MCRTTSYTETHVGARALLRTLHLLDRQAVNISPPQQHGDVPMARHWPHADGYGSATTAHDPSRRARAGLYGKAWWGAVDPFHLGGWGVGRPTDPPTHHTTAPCEEDCGLKNGAPRNTGGPGVGSVPSHPPGCGGGGVHYHFEYRKSLPISRI